jgi:uracil-DNA glycosylase family 4
MSPRAKDDPRAELADVAASLRAYLEWQMDTGATGIPRARRAARIATDVPSPAARASTSIEPSPAAHVQAPPPEPVATTPAAHAPAVAPSVIVPAASAPDADRAMPRSVEVAPAVSAAPVVAAPAPTLARLPVLAEEVRGCTRCALSATRTQTVFARGSATASLVFVGEGPGAEEDATGIPFVGRAGQLLDRMIGAMGLDPARDVYVCNIVKCRPPGNRRPEPEEMAACIPYLHEQLAIVNPKVIVALGNTAVAALLGAKAGITKVRGSWKLYKGGALVMPTYHPSYLLRPSPQQAEAKRQAWEDLQAVMKELKLPMPPRKV